MSHVRNKYFVKKQRIFNSSFRECGRYLNDTIEKIKCFFNFIFLQIIAKLLRNAF